MCLDLFTEKIKEVSLWKTMPDYKGINQSKSALPFIINKFLSVAPRNMPSQSIYTHTINALGDIELHALFVFFFLIFFGLINHKQHERKSQTNKNKRTFKKNTCIHRC